MRLTAVERQVAGMAGVDAHEVAAALRCTLELVRHARDRLGRDQETGLPHGAPRPRRAGEHLTNEDFDGLMRGNRSVCG